MDDNDSDWVGFEWNVAKNCNLFSISLYLPLLLVMVIVIVMQVDDRQLL